MTIVQNFNLKQLNTFGISVSAKYFAEVSTIDELVEVVATDAFKQNRLILGGGSNVLFTSDFQGLVLKNSLMGIEVLKEDDKCVYVNAKAGVNWHQFVLYCIDKGWAGIENLSLIPGQIGASPMQNIGAYGVEMKDVFHSLEAWNIANGQIDIFNREACQFGYRESVFKKELKGKYIITSVTFKLSKQPLVNISYGAIAKVLEEKNVTEPTIKDVSNAVIGIRSSKLPDPQHIGNAGSFFKNPVVDKELFQSIQVNYPEMPFYEVSDNQIKIPAGWLIETAGWKGYRKGDYGVHVNQALVLVNYNEAKGEDLVQLSQDIQQDIKDSFAISLQTEVNIV